MQFGIVTPVLNGRAFFRACAASVRAAATEAPSLRVSHYVRESSRSKKPCTDLAETFGCSYVRTEDNGLYDAIEAGLDQAATDGCDILAWLNADEQYLPGALAAAERVFESNPLRTPRNPRPIALSAEFDKLPSFLHRLLSTFRLE